MRTQNYLSVGQILSCEVFSPSLCFRPLKHLRLLNVFLQYKVLCSHKLDPLAHSGLQFPPYKLHFSNLFIPQRFFFFIFSVSAWAWQIQMYAIEIQSLLALISLWTNVWLPPSLLCVCVCVCVWWGSVWPGRVYLWFSLYIRAGLCCWRPDAAAAERRGIHVNLITGTSWILMNVSLETSYWSLRVRQKFRYCIHTYLYVCVSTFTSCNV